HCPPAWFRLPARRLAAHPPARPAPLSGDSTAAQPGAVSGADRLGRTPVQLLDGSPHAPPARLGSLRGMAAVAAVRAGATAGAVLRLSGREGRRAGTRAGQSTHRLARDRYGGAPQSGP